MSNGQQVSKKSDEYHDSCEDGRESSKKSKFSESRESEESVAGLIFHGVLGPDGRSSLACDLMILIIAVKLFV